MATKDLFEGRIKINMAKLLLNCRFCAKKQFKLILDLGRQPLAGEFLTKNQIGKEQFYPLRLYQCQSCGLVQLLDVVEKDQLFQSFLSSVNMSQHFQDYAKELADRFLNIGDFVIEIGSNDGVLLKPLKKMGMKVLGIESVRKIAKIAQDKGIQTKVDYFSLKVAKQIKQKAQAILANNVFAHIDNLKDVMDGVDYLLEEQGVFIFEVHFLLDLIDYTQYDTIYHEHLNYYSVFTLANFLNKWHFEITEVKPIPTHAGSIRVYTRRFKIGNFAKRVIWQKTKLVKLLKNIKVQGKLIIGYGAAGRANTLLNYCKITSEYLEYIIDESPLRYGRFTPGTHIKIIPATNAQLDKVDYILILAWNYQKEIMAKAKLNGFRGKFIIPLPKVTVIS